MASAVAILFLACQGIAVVLAATPALPQSSAGVMQGSCQDAGRDAGKNTDGDVRMARCQSQNASSTLSKVGVFTAIDLPTIAVRFEHPLIAVDSAPPVETPLLQIGAPPLRTLHCCLRN